MNIANKLTLLRVALVPVMLVFLLAEGIPGRWLFALLVFSAASITDTLDGWLARKHGMITDFGKFLDPLADKVLVIAALVCFVELNLVSSIVVVIIIAREFMVTSLRLVASSGSGKVIAAAFLGKLKTVSQMVGIIAILAMRALAEFSLLPAAFPEALVGQVLMWIAAGLTVLSGAQYLWEYRSVINTTK